MKRILKKLIPRRPDEMEKAILFRAQRNAYIFLVIVLAGWSLYESCKVYLRHTRLNLFPCFLLLMALAVQTFSQLIMTRSAVKDDEDSDETGPLVRIILLACIIASIIATAVAAFLLMGVRV